MTTIKNFVKEIRRYLLDLAGKDVFARPEISINSSFYGTEYGGYTICPDAVTSDSIVYSFGLGDDISFDLEMIERHGVHIHAYDPAPEVKTWLEKQELPSKFLFKPIGISAQAGELTFYPSPNERINYTLVEREVTKGQSVVVPTERLIDLLQSNNHQKIDLLKIDIEGAEFDVLDDILDSDIAIDQLLIEFHHKFKIFEGKGIGYMKHTLKRLNEKGFLIFDVSSGGVEYAFVHKRITTTLKKG